MPSLLRKVPAAQKVFKLKDFFIERLNLIVERLDSLFTILGRLDTLETATRSVMTDCAYLLQSSAHTISSVRGLNQEMESFKAQLRAYQAQLRSTIQTEEYGLLNPETGLIGYLYSYLPDRIALDVGSNVGEVSERLLETGYIVHAFEPFPPVYELMLKRLAGREGFHAHNLALGREDGTLDLHIATDLSGTDRYKDFTQFSSLTSHSMPEDLAFTSRVKVAVRSLASLVQSKEIPQGIGVLKLDTEGYEMEVLRGMGALKPAVVVAEYWDRQFPFSGQAALNGLPELVREMRRRGYLWHLVLFRVYGSYDVSFYCNHAESVAKSWGNVVFFQDYAVFREALRWCSAVLPVTHFSA